MVYPDQCSPFGTWIEILVVDRVSLLHLRVHQQEYIMKPASRCLLAAIALILCTASVRSEDGQQATVSGAKDKAPWFCHDLVSSVGRNAISGMPSDRGYLIYVKPLCFELQTLIQNTLHVT